MSRLNLGLLVVILAGCAARPTGCPIEELTDKAVETGRSAAELVAANPHCQETELAAAYERALAERCAPEQGWRDGQTGTAPPGACTDQGGRIWLEAYNLGQRQREFSAELERIEAQIAALERSEDPGDQAAARRLGLERVRLIRELDAIRGAAQIRGWAE